MFESCSRVQEKTSAPLKRRALTLAVLLHATAGFAMAATNLWSVAPIVPASGPLPVYQIAFVPPSPPVEETPNKPPVKSPPKATEAPPANDAVKQPKVITEVAPTDDPVEIVSSNMPTDDTPWNTEGTASTSSTDSTPGGFGDGTSSSIGAGDFTDAPTTYRPSGSVKAPRLIEQFAPLYPEAAKQAGIEGPVIVEAIINEEGRVVDLKILRGHPLLRQSAKRAMARWRFEPGRLNGRPVRVYFTLTVNFSLKR